MGQRQIVNRDVVGFSETQRDHVIIRSGRAVISVIGNTLHIFTGEDEPGAVIAGPDTVGRSDEPFAVVHVYTVIDIIAVDRLSLGFRRDNGHHGDIFRHFRNDAV